MSDEEKSRRGTDSRRNKETRKVSEGSGKHGHRSSWKRMGAYRVLCPLFGIHAEKDRPVLAVPSLGASIQKGKREK